MNRIKMNRIKKHTPITPESMLASIEQATAKITSKVTAEVKEMFAESRADFDRGIKESRADFDRKMEESRADYDRRSADLNKQLKELSENVGGWNNSHGAFAEEYFFNSFERGRQNFFGEKFDYIKKNLKGAETDDEFDVVMFNGSAICIVEVKFRGRSQKISKLIKKAQAFRDNFPKYKNHKIFLAYASLVFEDECISQGIAVVKQSGDNVVIYDENLKAF